MSKKFENFGDLGLNAPQFPGQQVKGMSIDQIRTLIKKQRRIKGYSFTIPSGQSTQNIQLSGTARILLGIAMLPNFKAGVNTNPYTVGFQNITEVTLKINNEIVIENLHPNFLSNFLNDDEYNYLPRPLSGTDQIILIFNNPNLTENVSVAFYYI
jgi:hypothetical protein